MVYAYLLVLDIGRGCKAFFDSFFCPEQIGTRVQIFFEIFVPPFHASRIMKKNSFFREISGK